MIKNNYWFITLCALLIASVYVGLNTFMRIAIGANAVVILIKVIAKIWRFNNGREKEENQNFDRG